MRIATYNVWNDGRDWARRLAAIVEELTVLDADIVALQEVPTEASVGVPIDRYLREHAAYAHVVHLPYPGSPEDGERPEGLAFLSKMLLEEVCVNWDGGRVTANSYGARTLVRWQGCSVGITTVHLDWKRASSREQHIAWIVREMIDAHPAEVELLCGDFNDDGDACSLRFLEGRAAIDGHRTRWRDLVHEWHSARGETPPVTLDFAGNPRWEQNRLSEPSKRFDRIYLRDARSGKMPVVVATGLFGKTPVNSLGLVPSDHYGVYIDLELPREA